MPARHPLKDLPLGSFAPLDHKFSAKRPLSPSSTLLSPSKRRILSAEGLYSSEMKTTYTPSRQLFSEFVGTPPSPARKLTFAALSHPAPHKAITKPARDASLRPETPSSSVAGMSRLQPSPEIESTSASSASTSSSYCDATLEYLRVSNLTLPLLIPREMPTFSDRQSAHWPGFDVHPDTHITIPTSHSVARTSDAIAVDTSDADDAKENTRPRKRAGKRLAPDDWTAGKTPKPGRAEKHVHGPTDVNIVSMFTAPPDKSTMTPQERQRERRQMRLIMVREQDQELNDEEDIDEQL